MDRFASWVPSRAPRRVGAALATMLAVSIAVVALAPMAEAHHSEITATTDCSLQVSWTATSWQPNTDSGINHSVKVWYTPDDGSSAGTSTTLTTGHFDFDDDFHFGGTFPWPAGNATSLTVSVQEQVWWGANEDKAAPASPRTAQVTKPGNCPASPSANTTVTCANGDGVASVTLTATGGTSAVSFAITNPVTHQTTNESVAPDTSKVVTISGLPDGSNTIAIVANGQHLDQTVNVTCDRPGVPDVKSSVECVDGAGTVTITLGNTGGDKAVTFVVTPPGKAPVTTTVAPGQSTTVVVSGLPDGATTIPVTADGTTMNQTVTVHCHVPGVPSVTVSETCADFDGTATLTLSNTGGTEPVHFVVTNPVTHQVTTVDVGVGTSSTVTVAGLPDGTVTIPVTADGVAMDQTVVVDCDHPGTPGASATDDCTATGGTITVTLQNTGAGSQPVLFVVTNPIDQTTTQVTVAAGGTQTVTLTNVPDGSYSIPVSADGTALTPISVTVSCSETPPLTPTPPSSTPTPTPTTQNPNVVLAAELERAPAATATGTLPTTGSASTSLALIAGVFVVAGTALVVIGRRRTA